MTADPVQARAREWALILDRFIASSGVPETQVAESIGRNRKSVRRYRDPESTASLGLPDLEALPASVLRPILERLAASVGLAVCAVPEPSSESSDIRALGEMSGELSDVIGEYARAVSDGHLTAAEAESLDREALEAMSCLGRVREMCARARRERVIGVSL